ncbi:hypothetical protein CAPTEDRAFT_201443 [Capitella teleta]|uniref:CCHC-type domain-containing protein n=1 Tax=Capitella teleta TaxID=283909 RepID=R7T400_CAPTE|nr:hypothetical protein CAPTEDRAFT_201443 [Capitella teleta]|eukprot:ELT87446.1 hypothetical protein CAPTEDRAFT_201443 [Capitella teleta]
MASVDHPPSIDILTIPPRKDSVAKQNNVELANACILSMAEKVKIKVTNNDAAVKLADRSVNDGYLHVDGLHLSKCGTKKLVTNMNLTLRRIAKGDPTRNKPKKKMAKNTEPVQEIPEATKHTGSSNGATDDWLAARSKRSTGKQKRQFNKTQCAPSPTRNLENTRGHCWQCGEENHSHKNCRFLLFYHSIWKSSIPLKIMDSSSKKTLIRRVSESIWKVSDHSHADGNGKRSVKRNDNQNIQKFSSDLAGFVPKLKFLNQSSIVRLWKSRSIRLNKTLIVDRCLPHPFGRALVHIPAIRQELVTIYRRQLEAEILQDEKAISLSDGH